MPELPVDHTDATTAVIRPRGRLDLQTAQPFRSKVAAAVESGHIRIVVDLAAVTFMDSSGLGALIAGLKTARQAGGELRIAAVSDQVTMVLELTQMHRVLRAHDTVDDALDGM